ncbi:hypothetical protein [Xanthomonas euvesicatoria]|uniref:hypothetical protein n=1 Tax=Xanthomonas euvesicatoria TaxID=456327 RepID=UPI001C475F41|nr:hypothetical protein [Xanthomonas euvesicatoria]MBV6884021.1 hypothetical protein [Xanthomonas campestris pv. euphorbiae]
MSFNLRRTGCGSFIAPGLAISMSKISRVGHPSSRANARAQVVDGIPVNVENPRTRSYGVIGGEIQELET